MMHNMLLFLLLHFCFTQLHFCLVEPGSFQLQGPEIAGLAAGPAGGMCNTSNGHLVMMGPSFETYHDSDVQPVRKQLIQQLHDMPAATSEVESASQVWLMGHNSCPSSKAISDT
jgi:hypothetical protein